MSIQIHHVHKQFGNFIALNDVSLDFPTGELVALLGPSGCGKTTLLRIIAGLETADRGQIALDGENASDKHVRERQIGFVFQHYALFQHMNVYDNIAFGLRMKPRRERPSEQMIRNKVNNLLALVQLEAFTARFPAQLSGGQRQRVALARALAVEPKVLLLDEPFGALDAKVRKELRRWLRTLHDELHITSVFVTHDQEEALEVADRVVLMNQGRVEQVDTPEEIYRHPATPFVYGFLGSVNRFEGKIDGNAIRVGKIQLAYENKLFRENADVIAFARPHELNIVTSAACSDGIEAQINRILSFGVNVRVELAGIDDAAGAHFEVELASDQAFALKLAAGQCVRLLPSYLSVFERQGAAEAIS